MLAFSCQRVTEGKIQGDQQQEYDHWTGQKPNGEQGAAVLGEL